LQQLLPQLKTTLRKRIKMAKKIRKRVSRIINGSLNALLTKIENNNSEMLLEESIKEIEEAVEDVRSEKGKCLAAKHNANKKMQEKNTRHELLSGQIQMALTENREDLAKAAIAEQLDIEAQIPVLEEIIIENRDKSNELETYINALLAKKREMQHEIINLKNFQTNRLLEIEKRVEDSNNNFERIICEKNGVVAIKGLNQDAKKIAELEAMSHEIRIKERLKMIKNKMDLEE
jgi:phage shock protein A